MLTSQREYRQIVEQAGLIKALETRITNAGQQMEILVLRRLADRIRSNECHGMSRGEIASWIEALTYSVPSNRDDQTLDLFPVEVK